MSLLSLPPPLAPFTAYIELSLDTPSPLFRPSPVRFCPSSVVFPCFALLGPLCLPPSSFPSPFRAAALRYLPPYWSLPFPSPSPRSLAPPPLFPLPCLPPSRSSSAATYYTSHTRPPLPSHLQCVPPSPLPVRSPPPCHAIPSRISRLQERLRLSRCVPCSSPLRRSSALLLPPFLGPALPCPRRTGSRSSRPACSAFLVSPRVRFPPPLFPPRPASSLGCPPGRRPPALSPSCAPPALPLYLFPLRCVLSVCCSMCALPRAPSFVLPAGVVPGPRLPLYSPRPSSPAVLLPLPLVPPVFSLPRPLSHALAPVVPRASAPGSRFVLLAVCSPLSRLSPGSVGLPSPLCSRRASSLCHLPVSFGCRPSRASSLGRFLPGASFPPSVPVPVFCAFFRCLCPPLRHLPFSSRRGPPPPRPPPPRSPPPASCPRLFPSFSRPFPASFSDFCPLSTTHILFFSLVARARARGRARAPLSLLRSAPPPSAFPPFAFRLSSVALPPSALVALLVLLFCLLPPAPLFCISRSPVCLPRVLLSSLASLPLRFPSVFRPFGLPRLLLGSPLRRHHPSPPPLLLSPRLRSLSSTPLRPAPLARFLSLLAFPPIAPPAPPPTPPLPVFVLAASQAPPA